jgi:hypothetical protein
VNNVNVAIIGDVPAEVQNEARKYAAKLLQDHIHCQGLPDDLSVGIEANDKRSFNFTAKFFFSTTSCTHKATFSPGVIINA